MKRFLVLFAAVPLLAAFPLVHAADKAEKKVAPPPAKPAKPAKKSSSSGGDRPTESISLNKKKPAAEAPKEQTKQSAPGGIEANGTSAQGAQ